MVCLSLQGLALGVCTVLCAASLHSSSLSLASHHSSLLGSSSGGCTLARSALLLSASRLEHLAELLCA